MRPFIWGLWIAARALAIDSSGVAPAEDETESTITVTTTPTTTLFLTTTVSPTPSNGPHDLPTSGPDLDPNPGWYPGAVDTPTGLAVDPHDRPTPGPRVCGVSYAVRKGDTCGLVGARNGLSVQELLDDNPRLDGALCGDLPEGHSICIPSRPAAAAAAAPSCASPCAVKERDTCEIICVGQGLSLVEFIRLNPDLHVERDGACPLRPGQTVCVAHPAGSQPPLTSDGGLASTSTSAAGGPTPSTNEVIPVRPTPTTNKVIPIDDSSTDSVTPASPTTNKVIPVYPSTSRVVPVSPTANHVIPIYTKDGLRNTSSSSSSSNPATPDATVSAPSDGETSAGTATAREATREIPAPAPAPALAPPPAADNRISHASMASLSSDLLPHMGPNVTSASSSAARSSTPDLPAPSSPPRPAPARGERGSFASLCSSACSSGAIPRDTDTDTETGTDTRANMGRRLFLEWLPTSFRTSTMKDGDDGGKGRGSK